MHQSRVEMRSSRMMLVLFVAMTAACAARPLAAARVGSAEAAVRTARNHGAMQLPDAALHLRLAEDQVVRARRLIDDGEHERAAWLLVRAEADATVADALAREAEQKAAAEETSNRARVLAAESGGAP
jgi:hypothetical protein